jgi:glycosyltransferase involved in cell wall biosynthesis
MAENLTVAIDARWIFPALSGVGVYTRNLIRHIARLDEVNRYVLLFDDEALMHRELSEMGITDRKNFSPELLPYSVFSLRNQWELPRTLNAREINVFHSPNFMIPLMGMKPKTVVTVHDLIPLLFPHYTGRSKKRRLFALYKRIMRRVSQQANAILADSDCTRNDILRVLKAPPEKVRRVYLGVDEKFCPGGATGRIRRRFGISGRLLLCVGRQDPYKNVITAVKALDRIAKERPDLNCQMLIVGERDPRYPEVARYVSRRNLSGNVVMTDTLREADLVDAYREADVLVHLSLYEGFGLPPLEAMACGTPVVSSDRASLPEVLGEAALFTDPRSVRQAAEKIIALLTDEDLRRQLISRGKQQAAKYTWEKTAKRVVEVYRTLAAGGLARARSPKES